MTDDRSQREKFEKLAREAECDENESHWDERLRKIMKKKSAPEKSD